MNRMTRRRAMKLATGAGVAALAAPTALSAAAQRPQSEVNREVPVQSRAKADSRGPRELFAVVDANGDLKRGLHAVSARRLDTGVYEVVFKRDVRRGVYQATIGSDGFLGPPPQGLASVAGRANHPRAVLVATYANDGGPRSLGFHLLVVCPDGYA